MITATHLTKRYNNSTAVDDISFTVQPGVVTGLVGPNGAGKSTTMRMIVGLETPTSGSITVNGHRYLHFEAPLTQIGVLLDASQVHPSRRARDHLRIIAQTHGISSRRVSEVIGLVGLESVANKRFRQFSLGMKQRLGIAAALLGDPDTLVLDEPTNGLDRDGVLWVRQLCRSLAAEGRAVLLSTHAIGEMQQTADHIIAMGKGRIILDDPIGDVLSRGGEGFVRTRTNDLGGLESMVTRLGGTMFKVAPDTAEISGLTTEQIATGATRRSLLLYELTSVPVSLERAVFDATREAVEYRSHAR